MAAPPSLSARLRYLNDSAHLLATTSPVAASFFMSQYHKVAFDHDLTLTDSRKREVCSACGNIMISGWSSHTYPEPRPGKRAKSGGVTANLGSDKTSETDRRDRVMIYECRKCSRKTRQTFERSSREKRQHVGKVALDMPQPRSASSTGTQPTQASIKQSSINSSSKRRAKVRKQGGLQAMLAKAKAGETTSRSLDLMDLMKTS